MASSMKCLIQSFHFSSPIGSMVIQSCSQGVHLISQIEGIDDSNFEEVMRKRPILKHDIDPNQYGNCFQSINECIHWLSSYFSDPQSASSMPLPKICPSLIIDKFTDRVWILLASNIGPGKTISYKGLAEMAKSPGAARAVGSAMAANPFQIVVPCHRVLPSDGKLGKYAHGKKNKVKAWLLHHEGAQVTCS